MYTENQSRQLYVLNATASNIKDPGTHPKDAEAANNLNDSSPAGAAKLICKKDEAFFFYKGPQGGLQRSDLIKKCNVKSVTCTSAASLAHKMKAYTVKFISNVTPIVGQTYMLTLNIREFMSMDYNTVHNKWAVTKAITGDTAQTILTRLKASLDKNMGREPITYVTSAVSGTGANAVLTITEAQQPWRRGVATEEFVNFEVLAATVLDSNGEEVNWATVEETTNGTIPNNRTIADMEYFFHKQRGDIYGQFGYPDTIDTEYQVKTGITDSKDPYYGGYSVLDIHFYYEGNSMNVGHSEKTITFVGTQDVIKKLIGHAANPSASPAVTASGLHAWLAGTPVTIETVGTGW